MSVGKMIEKPDRLIEAEATEVIVTKPGPPSWAAAARTELVFDDVDRPIQGGSRRWIAFVALLFGATFAGLMCGLHDITVTEEAGG